MADARAGRQAMAADLVDVDALLAAYTDVKPDLTDPAQRVIFGTSGHRGSSVSGSFNSPHILATTQAICDYRRQQGTSGPLLIGRDTHALSYPAWTDALEVLSANGVEVLIDSGDGYTPTPAVSHAILRLNGARRSGPGAADGIVLTPSHNPPGDGGFKYNPPHGGPADSDATGWIAERANALLDADLSGVERTPLARALSEAGRYDFLGHYVEDLAQVLDIDEVERLLDAVGAGSRDGAIALRDRALVETAYAAGLRL